MFIRNALRIGREFFTSERKLYAWILLFFIIGLELCFIFINVKFNYWSNDFYNTLQDLNYPGFIESLKFWCVLVFFLITTFVAKYFINSWLQLQWRIWMTENYIKKWTHDNAFYGIKVLGQETDNPDQRIAEDVRSFIGSFMSLSIGLMSNLVTLFSFLHILWGLSGTLDFYIGDYKIIISGYLVWVAFIYTLVCTIITHLIGKPLSSLLFQQEHYEADFRYSLVRLRENAESIAFFHGENFESKNFSQRFKVIVGNTIQIIKCRTQLALFVNFYNYIANLFPILTVAPRFFRKEIHFGGLMQTANAFGQVQGAMNWIIDSYVEIANFKAVTSRLTGFLATVDEWKKIKGQDHQLKQENCVGYMEWKNLEINLPSGESLINVKDMRLEFNNNYIIKGSSGIGKSTLIRTLSGIWPFAKGMIYMPERAQIMFVPQKAYMPLGSLLNVLSYPNQEPVSEEMAKNLLDEFNLGHLQEKLHEIKEWGRILSGGEQQKISFIRIVLHQPQIAFLDEATNALDEENVLLMYNKLRHFLPKVMLVSVGHTQAIDIFHNKVIKVADKSAILINDILET